MTDGNWAPGRARDRHALQGRTPDVCAVPLTNVTSTERQPEGDPEPPGRASSRRNSPGVVVAHNGTEAARPEKKVTKTEREETRVTVSTVVMGTRLHVRPGVPRTWGTHAQERLFNRQRPQGTRSAALAGVSVLTPLQPVPSCPREVAGRGQSGLRSRPSGPAHQDRGWHSALQRHLLNGSGLPKTPTRAFNTSLCLKGRTCSRDKRPDRGQFGNR